ncbi:ras association domain-containing protein 10 [Syngnathoides biaculeatus]|uniref:ras association domain-containing protein 10 n=1 Tax=Syngnathoides biaculeatus TaxID=300417 RepID=UPI002ADD7450|nr:ras association domain-containing protein 10 [Syngnathoides biaculeatus]
MDSVERRISVWVRAEEKLVLGLSKRTTCADVVKALLEDLEDPKHRRYCIAETWRGLRRILPDRTRIWRLWVAWGAERDRVRFALVGRGGSEESARSGEARVVPLVRTAPGSSLAEVPLDKQRRAVRKAFRKLHKAHKKRASSSRADEAQTLAQLVLFQERTIRLQALRLRQLDAEIERREAEVHLDRTRTRSHGDGYVQDAYSAGARGRDSCSPAGFPHPCDGLCQEELWEQGALADMLIGQTEEELDRHWMRNWWREEEPPPASSVPGGEQMFLEERLRRFLDATSYVGRRLRSDLEAIRGDLELSRQIWSSRHEEMRDLLEKINSLGSDDGGGADGAEGRKSQWVERARGWSEWHRGNDEDSDTGLSSLHSQESDSIIVCQSLV